MDLFCPTIYVTIIGNKYGLVIIDDLSIFTCVFFISDNNKVLTNSNHFVKRVEKNFKLNFKKLISDNGSEFQNARFFMTYVMIMASSMSSRQYTPQ